MKNAEKEYVIISLNDLNLMKKILDVFMAFQDQDSFDNPPTCEKTCLLLPNIGLIKTFQTFNRN